MTIGEKIKEFRKIREITQQQLADKLGVKRSAISKYEKNIVPLKLETALKISEILEMDPYYLIDDDKTLDDFFSHMEDVSTDLNNSKMQKVLNSYIKNGKSELPNLVDGDKANEVERRETMIENFEKLNEKGQIKAVENIVDLTKIQEYRKENSLESKTIDFEKEKKKRELPYYTIGASAGNGNFLATNDYILIEADEYVPQEANYALCVKGDSMEPKYKNGQMIYVKTQKSVENGEIGIFCLNNDVYVKKFECENGKCMLISLNPAYDPIKINDSDEIMCFGKVLN